jgi:hypothetical protein
MEFQQHFKIEVQVLFLIKQNYNFFGPHRY